MKRSLLILFTVFLLTLISFDSSSQCAMCRRVAETSQSEGSKSARGLNSGILYLLAIPYILGGFGVYFWNKNRKRE